MSDEPSTAALLTILEERDRVITELHTELNRAYERWGVEKQRCEFLEGRVDPVASERISTLEREASMKKADFVALEMKVKRGKAIPYVLIAVAAGLGWVAGVLVAIL
jgi:predicted RNase H-like nuclease (RuvC/YqgF family)